MALQQPSKLLAPRGPTLLYEKKNRRHRNQWSSLALYLPSFCSGKEWTVCPSCSSVWWMSSVYENPSNETSVLTCVSYCPAAQGGFPCATKCLPSISHWQWLLHDGCAFRHQPSCLPEKHSKALKAETREMLTINRFPFIPKILPTIDQSNSNAQFPMLVCHV